MSNMSWISFVKQYEIPSPFSSLSCLDWRETSFQLQPNNSVWTQTAAAVTARNWPGPELGALKGMTGCWEDPQLIFLSTFLELVQTGLVDVRHDGSWKLSPCSETWGEFIAMVVVLCGAGRERKRSGDPECIHHLVKPPWQHRRRTVNRSALGGGVGTAEVIDLCCNQLNLL